MKTKPPPAEEITPVQKLRMQAAAEAIATGKHLIPLRCGHCRSTSLHNEHDELHAYAAQMREREGEYKVSPREPRKYQDRDEIMTCVACGRKTYLATARRVRKQEITAYIRAGIDVPLIGQKHA